MRQESFDHVAVTASCRFRSDQLFRLHPFAKEAGRIGGIQRLLICPLVYLTDHLQSLDLSQQTGTGEFGGALPAIGHSLGFLSFGLLGTFEVTSAVAIGEGAIPERGFAPRVAMQTGHRKVIT